MFIVLGCMLAGMGIGYLLRKKNLKWIHRVIISLIWLLLFLLGLEIGSNDGIIRNFVRIGWDAFLITIGGTLMSVILAAVLWRFTQKKNESLNS